MFNRSRAMLAAVVMGALACTSPAAVLRLEAHTEVNVSSKRKRALFTGAVLPSHPSLSGTKSLHISVAQCKRNAAKRRNKRRHKRHLRG